MGRRGESQFIETRRFLPLSLSPSRSYIEHFVTRWGLSSLRLDNLSRALIHPRVTSRRTAMPNHAAAAKNILFFAAVVLGRSSINQLRVSRRRFDPIAYLFHFNNRAQKCVYMYISCIWAVENLGKNREIEIGELEIGEVERIYFENVNIRIFEVRMKSWDTFSLESVYSIKKRRFGRESDPYTNKIARWNKQAIANIVTRTIFIIIRASISPLRSFSRHLRSPSFSRFNVLSFNKCRR